MFFVGAWFGREEGGEGGGLVLHLNCNLTTTTTVWREKFSEGGQEPEGFDERLGDWDDNIPSWLFWPACLPWDHHLNDWISTFF